MAAKTRLLLDGYGGRRAGSFAGKTGVTHDATGALVGAGAAMAGAAAGTLHPVDTSGAGFDIPRPYRRIVHHSAAGRVVGPGAKISGQAQVIRTGQNTLALLLIAV